MANLGKLTSAKFGNAEFKEVYSASYECSGITASRSKNAPYQANGGTITLEVFDSASHGNWGKRDGLTLAGDSLTLTVTALCTSVSLSAQVNDVNRYSLTFTVIS
jgi:hypothetical protein